MPFKIFLLLTLLLLSACETAPRVPANSQPVRSVQLPDLPPPSKLAGERCFIEKTQAWLSDSRLPPPSFGSSSSTCGLGMQPPKPLSANPEK